MKFEKDVIVTKKSGNTKLIHWMMTSCIACNVYTEKTKRLYNG